MLPLRYVAHKYTSLIHIFRSSPLLFPTDGLKNSINEYHEHLLDVHGIFSFLLHLYYYIILSILATLLLSSPYSKTQKKTAYIVNVNSLFCIATISV